MPIYKGTVISGYIFIGKVRIYRPVRFPSFAPDIASFQVDSELKKLKTALRLLEQEIKSDLERPDLHQLDKDILNTHLMIITDVEILSALEQAVQKELMSAPQAVLTTFTQIGERFRQMQNHYLAQRAEDYKDVQQRLLNVMLNGCRQPELNYAPDEIIFLREITPSLVSLLAKSGAKAYCSMQGSYTSHSSILTRALGLTAMLANENILDKIHDGEQAVLNAADSQIIINPEKEILAELNKRLVEHAAAEKRLQEQLSQPAITLNQIKISLLANLEDPADFKQVLNNHCEGVGLLRTEFIYMNRTSLPDEEEQTEIYSDLLNNLKGQKVIFRTFDLGGDKLTYLQNCNKEENPYLGCRGIRFSLKNPAMFKTQVRAILRASVKGKAAIMFPMVIGTEDFCAARDIVRQCAEELSKEGVPFASSVPLGAMIETPSAALCSEQLAKVCDFFSIGTNDLVQYTLAVDRNNQQVASYYIQHHPAVILLLKQIIKAADSNNIPVAVCGEMASLSMYIPLLIGLGVRELSLNPAQAAEVKAVIRKCDGRLFDLVNSFDFNTSIQAVETFLTQTLKDYYTI